MFDFKTLTKIDYFNALDIQKFWYRKYLYF